MLAADPEFQQTREITENPIAAALKRHPQIEALNTHYIPPYEIPKGVFEAWVADIKAQLDALYPMPSPVDADIKVEKIAIERRLRQLLAVQVLAAIIGSPFDPTYEKEISTLEQALAAVEDRIKIYDQTVADQTAREKTMQSQRLYWMASHYPHLVSTDYIMLYDNRLNRLNFLGEDFHLNRVAFALRHGLTVPEEVKKDYPQIFPPAPSTQRAPVDLDGSGLIMVSKQSHSSLIAMHIALPEMVEEGVFIPARSLMVWLSPEQATGLRDALNSVGDLK